MCLNKSARLWLVLGIVGFCILPWYVQEDGFWGFEWLIDGYPFDPDYAPALFLIVQGEKLWLSPLLLWLVMPLAGIFWAGGLSPSNTVRRANVLIVAGVAGLLWLAIQGYGIGLRGWNFDALTQLFGPLDDRQFGMGSGALFVSAAFLFYLTNGIAGRGAVNGDVFVVGAIGFVIAMVAVFIFFPIVQMLSSALRDNDGVYSFAIFAAKFFDNKIWGLGCLQGGTRCGVAWNSLFLAVLVGFSTTCLGLVFALVATRSGFKYSKLLRALTVLPIITPPFVIWLAIILLFGLSGAVTQFVAGGRQPIHGRGRTNVTCYQMANV